MKYPRTFHLPNSPNSSDDDRVLSSSDHFLNREIVIQEKLDGSNVCLTSDSCFSRSHSGPPTHSSFDQFKALHSQIKHLIPSNIQIYGEWCFAKHHFEYSKLPNYLFVFAVFDLDKRLWLSWQEVTAWSELLNLPIPPVLYSGIIKTTKQFNDLVKNLATQPSFYSGSSEGIVVRLAGSFENFSESIAKYVNEFERTTHGWKYKSIIKNKLK